MVDNIVIMAGGSGKRLWPASVANKPKQFMSVGGHGTLFYQTLKRAFDLDISGFIYVVTHQDHVEAALKECELLSAEERERVIFLAEPQARNTAPALALASARMRLDGRIRESSLVLSADHLISPPELFKSSVELAAKEAENGFIVIFGIKPLEAATGYGYIEIGSEREGAFEVNSFREKPDAPTARRYVDSGKYYWNAGIFAYRNDSFDSELASSEPDIGDVFLGLGEDAFTTLDSEMAFQNTEKIRNVSNIKAPKCYMASQTLRKLYADCVPISIDYAMMEKSKKVHMVRSEFHWNDVGSWDALASLEHGNADSVLSYNSQNNFVYSELPVALCSVDNLIVVVSNNRVLVCRKGDSQLVKKAAEEEEKNLRAGAN